MLRKFSNLLFNLRKFFVRKMIWLCNSLTLRIIFFCLSQISLFRTDFSEHIVAVRQIRALAHKFFCIRFRFIIVSNLIETFRGIYNMVFVVMINFLNFIVIRLCIFFLILSDVILAVQIKNLQILVATGIVKLLYIFKGFFVIGGVQKNFNVLLSDILVVRVNFQRGKDSFQCLLRFFAFFHSFCKSGKNFYVISL